ncbi:adenosylcobinamide-GDP ribazoletransferase [Listeria ivanovii]|uniref:Adenosylcobinamide-GDP ribazoletransferase n=1 Tax=Listeria ivanovii (strain ATCC BAA-678 / PAM 55) TaxID=881621 RepID=G2ZEQ2_LISIP|nr:adenosylcobinamide-GDP ribazoletransferase [Listeria ivanovii]AHI55627.1 cobalamin synthase [Listeria ivanovii WSLC3009]AIS65079.1 cobalamin synthase [Listeria ivanovii subsp. ivanovii]MBC1758196.1 adenosylcobinamide-GDP ribazoletransferase [Listeria ivanovii]MBK3913073.1 adenosylcobinamide-GDP ribazoletransferase [Listeria ivanovii subsp. ivanovii]MBK3920810.1 adenosylcobinamide-GDP ribazoletransferase [Listeria ivanovii subsp. ivanovii]
MKTFILLIQFFTRIPVPIEINMTEINLKKGSVLLPLVGVVIGAWNWLVFSVVDLVMPLPVAIIAGLFAEIIITGGFHVDALADTADGLFSSRKKERMLEIMKDSRVGANGVIAICFYFLLYAALFISVSDTEQIGWLFFVLPMVAKGVTMLLFAKMSYAGSTEGLGAIFLGVSLWAIVLSQVIVLVFLGMFFSYVGLLAYLGVLLFAFIYRTFVYKRIGGMNGDTLGAGGQMGQLVCLFCLVLIWGAI